ncbi:probable E3 ubiquitin-protein ligase XBOS34 isoform X2 [Telopea speciosissima]|uniref:probable E3 ubiquitin-protein ligase XBOS34 isoform X2 n=1 Tax=Telopea speciosissima TaxID=54955 RepID=UPI001CC80307|nr:probable E3 ubiquitin-protein ligase XBOS34 isoform X2 [Telopea speciosissima]
MGQHQSKEELLYQQVNYGNIEGIKSLRREGAGLEWIDKEGRTPLIVACMNPQLFNVAKTLIELGANVNAYRGSHVGTPLHHAAKSDLDQTVKLLLSHGANALTMNDDCQTPLEVARSKGHSNVVRAIESHICFFSGWMRELHGSGFLEALAPQWLSRKMRDRGREFLEALSPPWLSRKIWVVVVPCGSRKAANPIKLEVAVYSSPQEAQPRIVIPLWKAEIEEPRFNQPDPTLVIFNKSTKTRYKFASANEGDKQQLQTFHSACKGIRQVLSSLLPDASTLPPNAPPSAAEDIELAMAISASIQSAMEETPSLSDTHPSAEVDNTNGWANHVDTSSHNGWGQTGAAPPSKANSSGWLDEPIKGAYNGWDASEAGPSSNPPQHIHSLHNATTQMVPETATSVPSAPPIPEEIADDGIHYPSIDLNSVDVSVSTVEDRTARKNEGKEDGSASSSCVICLDAPVEGACIPCGHMAGCMSCLKEIKAKKWGCPVCRAKIDQVLRLYAV